MSSPQRRCLTNFAAIGLSFNHRTNFGSEECDARAATHHLLAIRASKEAGEAWGKFQASGMIHKVAEIAA